MTETERAMGKRKYKQMRKTNNAIHRATYQKRKDEGLCTRCGKRWAEAGRCKCRICREEAQAYYRDNRVRERINEYKHNLRDERRENWRCVNCGAKLTENELSTNSRCAKCRKKRMEWTTVARIRMRIHGIKRKY